MATHGNRVSRRNYYRTTTGNHIGHNTQPQRAKDESLGAEHCCWRAMLVLPPGAAGANLPPHGAILGQNWRLLHHVGKPVSVPAAWGRRQPHVSATT